MFIFLPRWAGAASLHIFFAAVIIGEDDAFLAATPPRRDIFDIRRPHDGLQRVSGATPDAYYFASAMLLDARHLR